MYRRIVYGLRGVIDDVILEHSPPHASVPAEERHARGRGLLQQRRKGTATRDSNLSNTLKSEYSLGAPYIPNASNRI